MKKFLLQLTGALLVCLALGLTSCKKDKECTLAMYEELNFDFDNWYYNNADISKAENDYKNRRISEFQRDQIINDIVDAKIGNIESNTRNACRNL